MFCTQCNINWASLHSKNVDDECYEYCPLCKNDFFLEERKPGDSYVRNPFNGLIKNILTNQPYIATIDKPFVSAPPKKEFDMEEWKAQREAKIEKAIDTYQQIYSTHGKEAAEAAYFEACKK